MLVPRVVMATPDIYITIVGIMIIIILYMKVGVVCLANTKLRPLYHFLDWYFRKIGCSIGIECKVESKAIEKITYR